MLLFKILINSVISTPGVKFLTIDLANYYLNTPMKLYEYVKLHLRDISDEIIQGWKLKKEGH